MNRSFGPRASEILSYRAGCLEWSRSHGETFAWLTGPVRMGTPAWRFRRRVKQGPCNPATAERVQVVGDDHKSDWGAIPAVEVLNTGESFWLSRCLQLPAVTNRPRRSALAGPFFTKGVSRAAVSTLRFGQRITVALIR